MQAPFSTAICGSCGEAETEQGLVTLALQGRLHCVCPRCFHAGQIVDLCRQLPPHDCVRETVEDGLRALYELARKQVEVLCDRDGTEESQGQSTGACQSEGREEGGASQGSGQ